MNKHDDGTIELDMWYRSNETTFESAREMSSFNHISCRLQTKLDNDWLYKQKVRVTLTPIKEERKAEFTESEIESLLDFRFMLAKFFGKTQKDITEEIFDEKEKNPKGFRPGGVGEGL